MTTGRKLIIATVCGLLLVFGATTLPAPAGTASAKPSAKRKGHDASLIQGMACSDCHTPDSWKMTNAAGASGKFDHARTGFPLTGRHNKTSCASCHKAKRSPRRTCIGCHKDQHRGRLGIQCDQCHDSRAWKSTRAVKRHRRTRLPLTGMHALLACNACHVRTTTRRWDNLPADCFSCHEKDYRSTSIHPSHQGIPGDPSSQALSRQCQLCHRPSGWSPAVVTPSTLTRGLTLSARARHDVTFPIRFGKHRRARCIDCHLSPQRLPRLVACTGCHAHSGARLRTLHKGKVVARDGGSCLRCHPGGAAR